MAFCLYVWKLFFVRAYFGWFWVVCSLFFITARLFSFFLFARLFLWPYFGIFSWKFWSFRIWLASNFVWFYFRIYHGSITISICFHQKFIKVNYFIPMTSCYCNSYHMYDLKNIEMNTSRVVWWHICINSNRVVPDSIISKRDWIFFSFFF